MEDLREPALQNKNDTHSFDITYTKRPDPDYHEDALDDAPYGYIKLDYDELPSSLEDKGAFVISSPDGKHDPKYESTTHNPEVYTWWLPSLGALAVDDNPQNEGSNDPEEDDDEWSYYGDNDYDEDYESDSFHDSFDSDTLSFITQIYTNKPNKRDRHSFNSLSDKDGISLAGYLNCGMLAVKGVDKEGYTHIFTTHMEPGLFLSDMKSLFSKKIGIPKDANMYWSHITTSLDADSNKHSRIGSFEKAFKGRLEEIYTLCGDSVEIAFGGSNHDALVFGYYDIFLERVMKMVLSSGYTKDIPIIVGPNMTGGPTTFNISFDGEIEIVRWGISEDRAPEEPVQDFLTNPKHLKERFTRALEYAKRVIDIPKEKKPHDWDADVKRNLILANLLFKEIGLADSGVWNETEQKKFYKIWSDIAQALFDEESNYLKNHLQEVSQNKSFLKPYRDMPARPSPNIVFTNTYEKHPWNYEPPQDIIYITSNNGRDLKNHGDVIFESGNHVFLPDNLNGQTYWREKESAFEQDDLDDEDDFIEDESSQGYDAYVTHITDGMIQIRDCFNTNPAIIVMGKSKESGWQTFVASIDKESVQHLIHESLHEIYDPIGAENIVMSAGDNDAKYDNAIYTQFQMILEKRMEEIIQKVGDENISVYIAPGQGRLSQQGMSEAWAKVSARIVQDAGYGGDVSILGGPGYSYGSDISIDNQEGSLQYNRNNTVAKTSDTVYSISRFDDPTYAKKRLEIMKDEASYYITQFEGANGEDAYFGNKEHYLFAIRELYAAVQIVTKHKMLQDTVFTEIVNLANEGAKLLWEHEMREIQIDPVPYFLKN